MSNPQAESSDIIVSCKNISKSYTQGADIINVLNSLNFTVRRGERIAVVGSSGSGKTTFLNLLAGIDALSEGEIYIDQQPVHSLKGKALTMFRNQCLGFVYQFHHLLPEFTALENVSMPLLMQKKLKIHDIKVKAKIILEQVGLGHRIRHRPSALSGGERQRVAIARSLITSPPVVLMDEPTGNLDQITADAIQEMMLKLSVRHQTSFIVVTHDLTLAEKLDKIYQLSNGQFI